MNKFCLIFPGQGSQHFGMYKNMAEVQVVKETFEEAEDLLNFPLKKICWVQEEPEKLRDIRISSPLILTAAVAAYRCLTEMVSLDIALFAGHSLGEYSALTCAGTFTFATALELVVKRAEIASGVNGKMAVVTGLEHEMIKKICRQLREQGQLVYPCVFNLPMQTCVAYDDEAMQDLESAVLRMGGKVSIIIGNAPYHSELLSGKTAEFKALLDTVIVHAPQLPVLSNWSVKPYSDAGSVRVNLLNQFTKPVRWVESVDYIMRQGFNTFIEVGNPTLLSRIVSQLNWNKRIFCMDDTFSRDEFLSVMN